MLKKIIAIVIAAVIVAAGIIVYSQLPHSLNYKIDSIEEVGSNIEIVSKENDAVTVRNTVEGGIKILMFTDTHLDGKNKTSKVTVSNIVNNVQREKPDIVLFGGDNVTSGLNRKRANQLGQIFEKLGVYWGGVLGNHEGDNKYSVLRTEMMDIFMSYDHCLMLKGPDDVWGTCNYCLNILNKDDSLNKTFYFFDTGDEAEEEEIEKYNIPDDGHTHYDGVKESQVKWYSSKLEANTEKYGENESIAVLHIPIYQMAEAAENEKNIIYGKKLEGVCASSFDSGLFDAIKKGESTKYVFFGHDHLNTCAVEIDGVILSYIENSGYGSYTTASSLGYEEKDWLQGYTKLTISPDGTVKHEQFRNSVINGVS